MEIEIANFWSASPLNLVQVQVQDGEWGLECLLYLNKSHIHLTNTHIEISPEVGMQIENEFRGEKKWFSYLNSISNADTAVIRLPLILAAWENC